MKKKLAKLIDVKTIISFALIAVFCYLAIKGKVEPDTLTSAVMLVLGFFFASKTFGKEDKKDE